MVGFGGQPEFTGLMQSEVQRSEKWLAWAGLGGPAGGLVVLVQGKSKGEELGLGLGGFGGRAAGGWIGLLMTLGR